MKKTKHDISTRYIESFGNLNDVMNREISELYEYVEQMQVLDGNSTMTSPVHSDKDVVVGEQSKKNKKSLIDLRLSHLIKGFEKGVENLDANYAHFTQELLQAEAEEIEGAKIAAKYYKKIQTALERRERKEHNLRKELAEDIQSVKSNLKMDIAELKGKDKSLRKNKSLKQLLVQYKERKENVAELKAIAKADIKQLKLDYKETKWQEKLQKWESMVEMYSPSCEDSIQYPPSDAPMQVDEAQSRYNNVNLPSIEDLRKALGLDVNNTVLDENNGDTDANNVATEEQSAVAENVQNSPANEPSGDLIITETELAEIESEVPDVFEPKPCEYRITDADGGNYCTFGLQGAERPKPCEFCNRVNTPDAPDSG